MNTLFPLQVKYCLLTLCLVTPCLLQELYSQQTNPQLASRWEAAVDSSRKVQNWQSYAKAYNFWVKSLVNDEKGFWKAFPKGQEALDSISHYLSDTTIAYADALANQGYFFRRIGRLKEAKRHYDKSLNMYQTYAPTKYEERSTFYFMLGTVFYTEGDWLSSLSQFEKSMEIWAEAGYPYFGHIATCYMQLGIVYRKLEDWDNSRAYFASCLDYYYPYIRIEAAYGVAWAYLGKEMPDSSQYFLDFARSQQQPEQPYLPQVAWEIQGHIFGMQAKDSLALDAFRQAQKIRKERDPYRFLDLAEGEQMIAEQYAKMAQFAKAQAHLKRGLSFLKIPTQEAAGDAAGENLIYPQIALPIYIQMGDLYQQESRAQKGKSDLLFRALDQYEQAYQLYLKLREDRTAEASKLLLSSYIRQITEGALAVIYDLKQSYEPFMSLHDPFDGENLMALCWMERYHAGILFAERQKSESLLSTEMADSLYSRERDLLSNISFVRTEMQRLHEPEKIHEMQKELFQLQEKYRLLRAEIADSYPIYADKKMAIQPADIKGYIRKLDKDAGLIAFFWGEKRSFVLYTDHDRFTMNELPPFKEWEESYDSFQTLLAQPDNSKESLQAFIQSSAELYQILLGNLTQIGAQSKVFIMPDGPLAYLPFEVLLTAPVFPDIGNLSVSAIYRKLPYLCAQKELGYIHSLGMMHAASQAQKAEQGIAIFAPTYEGDFALKQNQQLGARILAYLDGKSFDGISGNKAVLTQEISNFRYVHLSVHGYPDEVSPWDAYLQFQPHTAVQERLYAHEIYNLQLPASLVTLAACDVGKGKLASGEGVLSLARAFSYAGASTVVQSRWKADARVTEELFPDFYARLAKGESSLAAFDKSRNNFLATASPDVVHPYFWANFSHWGKDKTPPSAPYKWILILIGIILIVLIILKVSPKPAFSAFFSK